MFIQELNTDNTELKGRLKKYEFENNDMNENLGEKEENIDTLEDNFHQKHSEI